jgi:uncharacterized membrane protein YfcA
MSEFLLILLPIFFFIAVIYSAAGFGGGSSYLAVLALFPLEFTEIRIVALLCNVVVVSGSVYVYYKKEVLKIKEVLPLVLWSVPLAYLGGSLRINQHVFFIILGITLFIASIAMLIQKPQNTIKLSPFINTAIGGSIGFLSGLVGIGGGIFLSPLLYLYNWNTAKIIAATTASFILVNSIAGLIGQVLSNGLAVDLRAICLLLITVLIGGQIGSRITTSRINPLYIRRITAFLILFVSLRILWKAIF